MSTRFTIGAIVLATLGAAMACASQGEPEAVPVPEESLLGRDAATDSADAAPPDAGPDRADAGPCAASGLCTFPVPIDERINVMSVSGSGANDVWAVGTERTILHYDGVAWEKARATEYDASAYTMRAVWASAPNDVWITDGPLLRHTTGWKGPNDTEWTSAALEGSSVVSPSSIGGKDGRVFIGRNFFSYDDAALVIGDGWEDAGVRDPIYMLNAGSSTGASGIWSLAITSAGEAWVTMVAAVPNPGAQVFRVYLESEDAGGGDDGALPVWNVEEHDSRSPKNLYGVWGDETVVWMVGEGGTIRRMTRDRIATRVFEIVPAPGIADLRGVYGFGGDDVWAVGDDATVLHWDGHTWTALATPFDGTSDKPRLFSVWGSGPKDVWIGGNGVMLHYTGVAP